MNDVWQRARDGEHTAQTETVLRLPHGHFSSKSSSHHSPDVTCTLAIDIRSQEALCIAYWGFRSFQRQLKLIGGTVLSTLPVVAKSPHTVVSEWGYGEAGLLKLTKANRGMGSYCSILVTTHADFVPRWMVTMFSWLPL